MPKNAAALNSLMAYFLSSGDVKLIVAHIVGRLQKGFSPDEVAEEVIKHARGEAQKMAAAEKFEMMCAIASRTNDDRDFEAAEDVLLKMNGPRAKYKKTLVAAFAKSGRMEEARHWAKEHFKSDYWRAEAYIEIYRHSGDHGDVRHAEEACSRIHNDNNKQEVLAEIKAVRKL